jgi:hypothetical protein
MDLFDPGLGMENSSDPGSWIRNIAVKDSYFIVTEIAGLVVLVGQIWDQTGVL